jgi:hypothetical protein
VKTNAGPIEYDQRSRLSRFDEEEDADVLFAFIRCICYKIRERERAGPSSTLFKSIS